MVEVGVCGTLDIKIYVANVVESLIDKAEGTVSVIDESMCKCWWYVRQHHGVTIGWYGTQNYRSRQSVWLKFGFFFTVPSLKLDSKLPDVLPTRDQNTAMTNDYLLQNKPVNQTTHHAKTNVLKSAFIRRKLHCGYRSSSNSTTFFRHYKQFCFK